MFENRSFDNVLGRLYEPGEVSSFEGVLGKELSNPIPGWAEHGAGRQAVDYGVAGDMNTPDPDPGEEYQHVNTQLFGIVDPDVNRGVLAEEMVAPFNAPRPGQRPTMDGFVADYISAFTAEMGRQPTDDEYAQIMTGYAPEQMPVLSELARGFAVFDHWFCEVPSQTFTNRSFFHAATASGYVVNLSPPDSFPVHNTAETIFDRLEANGPDVACLLRSAGAPVVHCPDPRGAAQGPLHLALLHHGPVLRRCRRGEVGDVLVHRAVPHARPQRHAPAGEHAFPRLRHGLAVVAARR
jgi:phospholipase C